jgi:signal peptidase
MKRGDSLLKYKILLVSIILAMVISLSPIKLLTITGKSMEPTITENDLIVVAPSNYKVGDVITYWHEVEGKRYLFTHRIIEIDGDTIRTKGDALEKPDNYVIKKSQVIGKVVLVLPMLGALVHFISHIAIAFILIPSLLLIAIEVRKIWRLRNA